MKYVVGAVVLAIALSVPTAASATTIVVLATQGVVVIAADSKGSRRQGDSRPIDPNGYCKITLTARIAIAQAGPAIGYNLPGRAATWSPLQSLWEFSSAIRMTEKPRPATSRTQVVAVGLQGDRPDMWTLAIEWLPTVHVAEPVDQVIPGSDAVFLPLGRRSSFTDDYLEAAVRPTLLRPGVDHASLVALAESLVLRQANVTPEAVGGPVDIAIIDAAGASWAKVKPACQ